MFILAVLAVLLFQDAASADIGPKPSMEFNLIYETTQPIMLIDGQQLQCEDGNCSQPRPLEQLGPQGFYFEQDSCSSMAYSYAPYQKLVLNFSDGTRESNVFEAGSYNARFDVRVTDTGLVVEERTFTAAERLPFFFVALVLTLIIEVLVALVFLFMTKVPKSVLTSAVKANLISLPVVWFIFPVLEVFLLVVVLSEIFAVIFEGYFIHLMDKTVMSLKQSFILSIIMNAASFIIGGFILLILALFLV